MSSSRPIPTAPPGASSGASAVSADHVAAWNAMSMDQRLRVYFELRGHYEQARADLAEARRRQLEAEHVLEQTTLTAPAARLTVLTEALQALCGEPGVGKRRAWFVRTASEALVRAEALDS